MKKAVFTWLSAVAATRVVMHRARSRATIGFDPTDFAEMARAEIGAVTACSPPPLRIAGLAWSEIPLPDHCDAQLVAAARRCALTHGVYEPMGCGADAAEAAHATAAAIDRLAWSSWSLHALDIGASARPSREQRAALLGPALHILSAAFASQPADADADAGHARLVAIFGTGPVRILRVLGSGAAVPPGEYDYVPTGTPHAHGHTGLLGDYTAKVRPRDDAASTAMVAELAFLVWTIVQLYRCTVVPKYCSTVVR